MFYFDENVMNEIVSMLEKNVYQVDDMNNGYMNKMHPISNSGLYGNGIETIDSQMISVKDGYVNFKNITSNNCNKIIELENKLTKEVDNIELPKDFDASDTGYDLIINNVNLTKNDGKQINEDNVTEKVNLTDYFGENMTELSKLKDEELHDNNLSDYKKTKNIDLNSISSEETKQQQLDDFVITQKKNLKNINDGNDTQNITYFDDYFVDQKDLEDISDKS